GRAPPPADAAAGGSPGVVGGAAPGLTALFEGVKQEVEHAVLDLGPAAESSLSVYGRFARRIRFADLLSAGTSSAGLGDALRAVRAQPEQPYDLVFGWDILDRLPPEARPALMERLTEVTAPG